MRKFALAAALLALAVPAYAQSPAPAPTAPQSTAPHASVSAPTKKFVTDAAITDMFEIQAGQLAQQKASDAAYKDFAQLTIKDHTATTDQLQGMMSKLPGVQLPQKVDSKHQALLDKLNSASGAAFERQYKADQIEGHRQAIAAFERYARSGDNPELKKWASDTLPTLKTHLQHAQALPSPQAPTVGSGSRK